MKKLLCLALCACLLLCACSAPEEAEPTPTPAPEAQLPQGLEEMPVTVGEGGEWPLAGLLTRSASGPSEYAAVLVHGSGPSDMDESVYEMKPFRDLAYGLASRGVDVLRYDKRTYVYGAQMAQDPMITVREETIDDAVAALGLLKDMGYEKVYLIGHSLGGMLALETDRQSGGAFAGIVSLAGSPRSLIDIIIDQNEAVIATMTNEQEVEAAQALVDAELEKLGELDADTDPSVTIFSMPAHYVYDLLGIDNYALAKEFDRPILILQGDKDFQVYAEVDYVQWQVALSENPNAQFKLYEGLNHMFAKAGETNSVVDYMEYSPVDETVRDDIAAFDKQ